MDRRVFIALALAGCASSAGAALAQPSGASSPAQLLGAQGDPAFIAWLNDFYGRSLAAGWPKALLDRELSGLSPDPRVGAADARQPEFARPVGDYVKNVISDTRVAKGRDLRGSISQLPAIERTYGVPRDILLAVWAMESAFGIDQGDLDVVRCLATLAAHGRRREWAETEINAAFRIISSGEATRSQLRGSWAGAMGQTQFLPSAYLSSGADGDGDGKRDIWRSVPDSLASAANLLVRGGWRREESWAREVILAPGSDYGLSEGPKQPPDWWEARGARRADGQPWRGADTSAAGTLMLPSGFKGPAFLLLPNHFAIRTYNNSSAYALGVGLLADRFAGSAGLKTPWPKETPLSLTERMDAQTALAKLGFYPGQPDGVVGMGTRQALRSWQKTKGLPADGYLSPEMVLRLRDEIAVPKPRA